MQAVKIIIELILAGLDKESAVKQAAHQSGVSEGILKKFYS